MGLRELDSHATIMTVKRGLEVLRAFRSDRTPLTNAELVRRTGLSKATVSRLTSTLIQVGFLSQTPGKKDFVLSNGALGIGHSYLSTSEILRASKPLMQELADRLDVSVALAVQDGIDMLYISYCVSQKVATLRLGVGLILSMSSTAIGRAYLWGLPAEAQSILLDEHYQRAGEQGEKVIFEINQSFDELEKTGTCAVLGGYKRNTYAVALPVRLGKQKTLLGMSCGRADVQPDLESERKRISPELKKTALELEKMLVDFDENP